MRTFLWAALIMLATGWLSLPSRAAEPEPDLRKEQQQLDAGDDLNSRARRVLFRSRAQQDDGAFAEAAAVMTAWLDGGTDRDHHLMRFNLAVSYFGLEQPAKALVALEHSVARAPRYARAWLRLGEAAYELADYARAGEAFAKAYDLSPDHQPDILYYAGVSLLSGNRPVEAVESLARLLDLTGDTAGLDRYQALIAAAVAAEKPARAAPYLEQMLEVHADNPEAWELAYRFYAGETDYEQAAAHLTIAGYLRPLSAGESVQLGDLYAVIGVPLQAARHYEQAFAGDGEPDPDEYQKLATAWLAAHQPAAARATLNTALAARPTPGLWSLLGDLEYMIEDYPAALAAFTKSTELDQEYGRGYLMMGYCALELGQDATARQHLTRAAAFPDQSAAARSLMGRLGRP